MKLHIHLINTETSFDPRVFIIRFDQDKIPSKEDVFFLTKEETLYLEKQILILGEKSIKIYKDCFYYDVDGSPSTLEDIIVHDTTEILNMEIINNDCYIEISNNY